MLGRPSAEARDIYAVEHSLIRSRTDFHLGSGLPLLALYIYHLVGRWFARELIGMGRGGGGWYTGQPGGIPHPLKAMDHTGNGVGLI